MTRVVVVIGVAILAAADVAEEPAARMATKQPAARVPAKQPTASMPTKQPAPSLATKQPTGCVAVMPAAEKSAVSKQVRQLSKTAERFQSKCHFHTLKMKCPHFTLGVAARKLPQNRPKQTVPKLEPIAKHIAIYL